MRSVLVAVFLGLAGTAGLAAQAPQPAAGQPPVFGVGVDIVAVDVTVVDGAGRPALGLGPEDFTVEVDGRPRKVASVEYVGRTSERTEEPAPSSSHYTSNEGGQPGRLVLLVVDRGSIGRGGGRGVLRSADRLLDGLTGDDRVGLAVVPGPGPSVEFTSDLAAVRKALEKVVGLADRRVVRVPLAEALAFAEGNDRQRWTDLLTLVCGHLQREADRTLCEGELESEALQVATAYRERSRASLGALEAALRGLRGIEGPKALVLVTEGLGLESTQDARTLAATAAEARVTLYVLLIEGSRADASQGRVPVLRAEDRDLETEGLYDLTFLTRGSVLRTAGTGDAAFDRIARELMGYYLLGFEPEPADRDGKSHAIKVQVARPRVTVRARGLLTIPVTTPGDEQVLAAALRAPLLERGLPLRVATFALHDPAPGRVRVVIAGDVARTSPPLRLAWALVDKEGRVASSRLIRGLQRLEEGRLPFVDEASVEPGVYDLRVAALDGAGRRGSVHHETRAALVSAGGAEISDLLLALPPQGGQGLSPAVDLEAEGGAVTAQLELSGRDAARLASATVALEVADGADRPAIVRLPVPLVDGERGPRVGRVTLAAGLLPPGDYVARAAVSVDGRAVAAPTRPFRVTAPRRTAGEATRAAPLATLLVEIPPFDRAELLQADVLDHFLERMDVLAPGPASEPLTAAIAAARQGRPEAMIDAIGGAAREDVRLSFLRGVSLFARGQLPGARTQLQSALRLQSDFLPAAVYLGGCLAAEGKNREAIGAWQTALIGESGSPALHRALADALLRTKEPEEAVEILKEALVTWPADEGLKRRLGLAHAMAGQQREALPLLTAWVDGHPQDSSALFAMLGLLFDGFGAEVAGEAHDAERERLLRYARAYMDGGGPHREVVARWVEYVEGKRRP